MHHRGASTTHSWLTDLKRCHDGLTHSREVNGVQRAAGAGPAAQHYRLLVVQQHLHVTLHTLGSGEWRRCIGGPQRSLQQHQTAQLNQAQADFRSMALQSLATVLPLWS